MPKKKPLQGKPEVHKELDGFEMDINEFGEITSNTNIDKLNTFLNKNVDDKKFRGLDNVPFAKTGDDDDEEGANKNSDDDLNEIADEFEEFRQFNDKDFKDEFDFDEKDENDEYFNESKHEYEQFKDEEEDDAKYNLESDEE